jgi:hypothetical protein
MAQRQGLCPHDAAARFKVWRVATLLALACMALPAAAEDLSSEVLASLRKATFEVVVEKPTTDSLSYERPLPFDLLPFRVRNDKYESIGTAFALGDGQFVSAAHVITLASESVRRRVHLRDPEGRIVDLDRVLKYSIARDFIVFSVKDYQSAGQLQTSTSAKRNDKIFAVGNALGEGVIVRDGLYTSDTPEEEDGRWKWLRFSAAASPGNSGGPLVDREGRVIGVVLRKSQNENLNFALPIAEVLNASSNKAEIHVKAVFKLDITDRTLQGKIDETVDLPSPYQVFGRELQKHLNGFSLSLSEKFKATYRDDMFPAAPGAQGLLYRTSISANFPRMLVKQRDGTWDALMAGERREADLGKNGQLQFGKMGNFLYMRLKAPEDVSVAQMHKDSKLFMDLVLRGLYFSRDFGAEQVRITSMGAAKQEELFVDAYQRKWQVRRWTVEHSDEKIVTYALPQPDGFAIVLNAADESASYMYEVDMKTLADYAFVTYYGTLKQWKNFLADKSMLPAAFDSITVDAKYGKEFSYRSRRLAFSYPDELMRVSENSDLHLKFSYFKENDKVVWDVSSVMAGEDKKTTTIVSLSSHPRPPETLPDSDRSTWESLVKARMPYTGAAFFDKSRTVIATAYRPQDAKGDLAQSSKLYSLAYSTEGSQDAAMMEKKLVRFREGIQINER